MTDRELLRMTRGFRSGLLGKRSSSLACAMVCYPLVTLLGLHGVKCELAESDLGDLLHVYIKLGDGRILDPTLDQFNALFAERWPKVYLGPPTKYHADTVTWQ